MIISEELVSSLQGGLSLLIAGLDGQGRPLCTRGVGLRIWPDRAHVTVFLAKATAAPLTDHLLVTRQLAFVVSRPNDYRTVQMKGRVIALREADPSDRALVSNFVRAFADLVDGLGVPRQTALRVRHWPCLAVDVALAEIFLQTPGPGAGRAHGERRAVSELELEDLSRCFQGLIPCGLATASASGVPNITYLSQLLYIDSRHVGLSRQFFNKTSQNLAENVYACIQVHDALTYEAYRLHVRYERSESAGPLFEEQAARLDAIASHTGMSGVFRLQAVDVCEVLDIQRVEGFLEPPEATEALTPEFERGPLTELRALQLVSERINRAVELDALLEGALSAFDELLALPHSMVLLLDDSEQRLVAIASRGYGASGVGAEVRVGEGLIGLSAANRRLVRVSGLRNELRYSLAARDRLREVEGLGSALAEVSLPGLANAESQLALPLLAFGELLGVLVFESASGVAFQTWHEAFLQLLANQLAIGIAHLREERAVEESDSARAESVLANTPKEQKRKRTFSFFKNDDCVFVDGEYLVRNVPGRILWKLLGQYQAQARTEFNNRELRLDPTLGLPPVRTNLESRLLLLRKRLAEKCPDLSIVPGERGRFRLAVTCDLELVEREHA